MAKIIKINFNNKIVYYEAQSGQSSSNIDYLTNNKFLINKPTRITSASYPRITFCLEISSTCNLMCKYCFNDDKKNKLMSNNDIKEILDTLFNKYKDKEKYFIDLSGDGEPLTNIDGVLFVAQYVKKKQEEIRKEINVSFVTNGTLLTKDIINRMQETGVILYGISIDGPKNIHDQNRTYINNHGTYEQIFNNIKNIEHKEFLGCAMTLSNNIFNLTEELINLNKIFNTISVKPVRSLYFDKDVILKWCKEYEKLTLYLLEKINEYDYKLLYALINGDDYFGKFISRVLSNGISLNRCDAGGGRIFININKEVFPCVPLGQYKNNKCNIVDFNPNTFQNILDEGYLKESCSNCDFVSLCGGECFVEKLMHNGNNINMCLFKQKLISLAIYLKEEVKQNEKAYKDIKEFILNKRKLLGMDDNYKNIVKNNANLSFKECKSLYYKSISRDNDSIEDKMRGK